MHILTLITTNDLAQLQLFFWVKHATYSIKLLNSYIYTHVKGKNITIFALCLKYTQTFECYYTI